MDNFSKFYFKIAGAQVGEKGNEHNNLLLALTPTIKISLKRAFNEVTEKIIGEENGFHTFDCFSNQIEQVCVLGG